MKTAAGGRNSLTVVDILNAANKYYAQGYLSRYFGRSGGELKAGDGDTLAKFVVHELRETFVRESAPEQQVDMAMRVLARAKDDIQSAIDGLRELRLPR